MELNRLSWETFTRTGDIDAYLLYKNGKRYNGARG